MGALTMVVTLEFEEMGPCCECGTRFAGEAALKRERLRDHKLFYCPNGHPQHYTGESKEERLTRELEAQKQKTARAEDLATRRGRELDNAQLQVRTTRGKLNALKRRIANGVCPCCHRSFVALRRHMETMHPAWVEEQEKAAREMRLLGPGSGS